MDLENASSKVDINNFDYHYHKFLRHPRTTLSTSFFSAANIHYIISKIQQNVSTKIQRAVEIIPTDQFFDNCVNIMQNQLNYVSDVSDNWYVDITNLLTLANDNIIKTESTTHYLSLQRRELFFKWFIYKDKPRVITRAINTKGRHHAIKNDKYILGHPDKSQFDRYINYVNFQKNNQFRQYNPIFESVLNSK
jgi:hypothetical protein